MMLMRAKQEKIYKFRCFSVSRPVVKDWIKKFKDSQDRFWKEDYSERCGRRTAETLVKDLTCGTEVSAKTVSRVLHRNRLPGSRPRKTPPPRQAEVCLIQPGGILHRLKVCHLETKLELLRLSSIWRKKGEAYNEHGGGSICAVGMLQCVCNWESCHGGRNNDKQRRSEYVERKPEGFISKNWSWFSKMKTTWGTQLLFLVK